MADISDFANTERPTARNLSSSTLKYLAPPTTDGGFAITPSQSVTKYLAPPTQEGEEEVLPNLASSPYSESTSKYLAPPTPIVDSPVHDKVDFDPSIGGSFAAGLAGGGRSLVTSGVGLQALTSDIAGTSESENEYIRNYQARAREDSIRRNKYTTWDEVKEASGAWDTTERFGEWLSYSTGEQLPNIAAVLGGAFTGGSSAVMGVTNAIGRGMLKKQISKKMGQMAGAFAVTSGLETGHIVGEQIEATGEITPMVAITGGVVNGILEAATPIAMGRASGMLGSTGDEFLNLVTKNAEASLIRIGKGALKGAVMETATEVLQESVAITARSLIDKNYSWASDDVKSRLEESAVTAFFTSGVISGTATYVGSTRDIERGSLPDVGSTVAEAPPVAPRNEGVKPVVPLVDTKDAPLFVATKESMTKELPTAMEFQGAYDAGVASAKLGHDRKDQVFLALRDDGQKVDVTSTVAALPSNINVGDTRISFNKTLTPQEMDSTLATVNEAVNLNKKGQTAEANEMYVSAIIEGFRYEPHTGESFLLIGGKREDMDVSRGPQRADHRKGIFVNKDGTADTSISLRSEYELRPEALRNMKASEATHTNVQRVILRDVGLTIDSTIETIAKKWEETFQQEGFTYETDNLVDSLRTWRDNGWKPNFNAEAGLFFRTPNENVRSLQIRGLVKNADKNLVPTGHENLPHTSTLNFDKTPNPKKRALNYIKGVSRALNKVDIKGSINGGRSTTLTPDKILKGEKVNKVQLIQIDEAGKSQPDLVKNLHKALSAMQKKLAKGTSINLIIIDKEGVDYGWVSPDRAGGQKEFALVVNLAHNYTIEGVSKTQRVYVTLAHEFGHILSHRYLKNGKTPKGASDELVNAFNHWRERLRAFPLDQVTGEGFGVVRGVIVHESIFAGLDSKTQKLDSFGLDYFGFDTNYNLSFEEYIAEQMVLYVQSGNFGITGTEKFFDYIISAMKTVLRTVWGKAHPDVKYSHSSAFEALVEYVKQSDGQTSTYLEILDEIRENGKVWDERLGAYIDKESASGVRRVADGLAAKVDKKVLDKPVGEGKTVGQVLKEMSNESDYFNTLVKHGYNVFQLAKLNPHIKLLGDYISRADQWLDEKNAMQSRGNEVARQWNSLGKERNSRLSNFLFALDALPQHPTKEELTALKNKYDVDAAMMDVYEQVKGSLGEMLNRMEAAALLQLERGLEVNSEEYGIEYGRIRDEFSRIRSKPYFPHSRFGNYSVIGTDSSGKVVHLETVEAKSLTKKTPLEVKRLAASLSKEFPELTFGVSVIPEHLQIYQGMPPAIIKRISQQLASSLSEEDQRWLDTLSVQYAPGQSFRKKLLKRKNVSGYSTEGLRGYANYMWHGSNHLARVTHGQEMKDVVGSLRKEVSLGVRNGLDMSNRAKIAQYLDQHLEYILNPKPEWAGARAAAFTWWLGFSPASAILNFTQLPMVTLPHLSKHMGGELKASKAMLLAGTNLRNMYSKGIEKWNDKDARLITLALEQGFLEESLATELAGASEGSNLVRAKYGSKVQRGMAGFAHAAGWMFSVSEKMNRRITFNAAVELARSDLNTPYLQGLKDTMRLEYESLQTQHGLGPNEAIAFLAGKDSVRTTQFAYSAVAKPSFMRGKKGVLFVFQMYTQNMLWLMAHSPSNKRMFLTMLLMGGIMGLPGSDDIDEVVEFIGRKLFGVRYSAKEELGNFLTDLTNPQTADILMHGTAREGFGLPMLGDMLGLPIPRFDMSGNISMGNVIPGLKDALNNDKGSFESNFGRSMADIGGASIGIGINMMKFLGDTQLPIDDMKRWEKVMPRAFGNVARAMRYVPEDSGIASVTGAFVTPEGRERGRAGETIIKFDGDDPEHMMEIALKAMGFNPTRISKEWDRTIAQREVVTYWETRRSLLFTQLSHTYYTGDANGKEDVLSSIRRFNREAPFPEIRIKGKDIRASLKARKKIRLRRELDRADKRRFDRLHRGTGRIYEEDPTVISREVTR